MSSRWRRTHSTSDWTEEDYAAERDAYESDLAEQARLDALDAMSGVPPVREWLDVPRSRAEEDADRLAGRGEGEWR